MTNQTICYGLGHVIHAQTLLKMQFSLIYGLQLTLEEKKFSAKFPAGSSDITGW